MFDWLRRRGAAPPRQAPARQKAAAPRRPAQDAPDPAAFPPALPLPEVVGEGNTNADWSAWEDSVTALDSQLQELTPSRSVHVRDTLPGPLDEDPFASVRGKRDA